MKFLRSLLAKYMLIIITAIFLVQFTFVMIAMLMFNIGNIDKNDEHFDKTVIEEKWHETANNIKDVHMKKLQTVFLKWNQDYPDASMFWVDETGKLVLKQNVKHSIPNEWTASSTAKFIKEHYDQDPFTVIAFVGEEQHNGFIVFQIPREKLNKEVNEKYGNALFVIGVAIILLFIFISFLFFRSIRKRLLHVQEAMEIRDVDFLPVQIDVKKQDEIGQLERTFNKMVDELKRSKIREQEEEQLRRSLIANLSHDLRTPLTKMTANIYSLKKEVQTEKEKQAIRAMEQSIQSLDRLVDNLMSYTLLVASKYKYNPKEIDIIRFVRTSLATWYPLFEQANFTIHIQLNPFEQKTWSIDPLWMERILDNIYQNVLRHAKDGKYIAVQTISTDVYDAIIITDKGHGMKGKSNEKGAGIGLAIVDMMMKGLQLDLDIVSTDEGTTIKLIKKK